MMVLFFREGPNPERFIFIYNSHLLYQISSNINIVTEWIANEGRDSGLDMRGLGPPACGRSIIHPVGNPGDGGGGHAGQAVSAVYE